MAVSPMLIKAAAALLTDEKGRKGVGFLLVTIFAPVILIAAILCSATSGGADHNNLAVEASFYGTSFTESIPAEFRTHIADIQTAFSLLDSAVAEANAKMEDGNRLDPIQVKAIFYALCFGEAAPSQRAADRFVDCFFSTEQRTRVVVTEQEDGTVTTAEETYTATVPVSLETAFANLSALFGREITKEDKENAAHIYTMIAGNANGSDGTGASGGTIQIDYGSGIGSTELETSNFTDPAGKNAADLVQYAIHAYEEHWGYVWGTFGCVLTESLFEAKLAQYPDALETDLGDRIGLAITRFAAEVTRPVSAASPLEALAKDECVEAEEVARLALTDLVAFPLALAFLSAFILPRKQEI